MRNETPILRQAQDEGILARCSCKHLNLSPSTDEVTGDYGNA